VTVTSEGDGTFACHRCGHCCTNLGGRRDAGGTSFAELPPAGLYRLEAPPGLRLFAWEAREFPQDELVPLLGVADGVREALLPAAYVYPVERCTHYDDEAGCTVYEDRPLVCQAYPLLASGGGGGLELAVSGVCPGAVDLPEADGHSVAEAAAEAYPDEAGAARAVPALIRWVGDVVAFLAQAGIVDPQDGLDEEAVTGLGEPGPDVVDVAGEAGALDADDWRERAEAVRENLGP
jgi:Fe-S-cluster containining protein